jgi:hypothetical protein
VKAFLLFKKSVSGQVSDSKKNTQSIKIVYIYFKLIGGVYMGKIDTSYFDTKGRYEKFAKRYGVTILYVNKIPYHNNEVLFEHTQTLEVEQFFALAEEKKNVKSVLCEIKYFEASDFYVDFDEMLRLMYIFKTMKVVLMQLKMLALSMINNFLVMKIKMVILLFINLCLLVRIYNM